MQSLIKKIFQNSNKKKKHKLKHRSKFENSNSIYDRGVKDSRSWKDYIYARYKNV